MTKSDYISNSAKILLISSILLFVANALAFLGSYNVTFVSIAGKVSTISFYAVFLMGFLAFNGEGIAYKHSREMAKKKKTTYLKFLVLFAFLVRYVKTPIEKFALSLDDESMVGICSRLFLSLFNTVSSYGFLFAMIALWYVFRDSGIKKLLPLETCAFTLGLVYNIYKVFNYAVAKYEIKALGDLFVTVFSNSVILNVLCLLQFGFDILMFAVVLKFFNKKAIEEQEEKDTETKKMVTARKIYSTDCYGLDSLEDDFLLETNED